MTEIKIPKSEYELVSFLASLLSALHVNVPSRDREYKLDILTSAKKHLPKLVEAAIDEKR